ncbi:MAG: metalloregulator ArsR/SmtB family transcription factor [Candidatus Omnitrophica bacterium]|nr:metalloregulator ArsR/SmtB family transcription factor [Candidatus Omnitrophota bacterium]
MVKMDYDKDSEILKALGHSIRLKMVEGLMNGNECNVNKIVDNLQIPQSTVSQHLKVLKTSGIIACRKEGVRTCYRVIDKRVMNIMEILKR